MHIRDSACIVTGASTGIGRAVAIALGSRGASVAICARNEAKLQSVADQIRDGGGIALQQRCDVSDENSVDRFVSRVQDEFGRVDILVNNAGIGCFAPVDELPLSSFDEMLATNVRGLFLMTRTVVPQMKQRGSGHIINVASTAAKNGVPNGSAYAGTKHAVLGISKSLMLELRDHGIRVTVVCPGSVATEFFDKAGVELKNPDAALRPEDVANSIVSALELPEGALLSDLDIRPTRPAFG